MTLLTTLVLRSLRWSEGALSEMDNPLAKRSYERVHQARLDMETLQRIEERGLTGHATGDRS